MLLNPSAFSFREVALLNVAFCYSQMGQGSKAKEWYKRTLREFPNSTLAQVALRFIDSMNPSSESSSPKEAEG